MRTRNGPSTNFQMLANVMVYLIFFPKTNSLIFAGSHCVDPPSPDDKHSLKLMWNKKYPPKHNETVMYVCDAGTTFNRFESDFSQYNLTLTCLPDNRFEEVEWPTCADGERTEEKCVHTNCFYFSNPVSQPSQFYNR